jgi:hypothetical protein
MSGRICVKSLRRATCVANVLSFRKKIAYFLATDELALLPASDEQEWNKHFPWLDRSGLALPLAARLEALGSEIPVPIPIAQTLQTRLADNEMRMTELLRFFQEATNALTSSGVRYCCVKGFSLIPECFAGIRERHQVDFDFLVDPRHLSLAQGAIEKLGYHVQRSGASGEVRLTKPWKRYLGIKAYLYQLPEAPPIELHSDIWEPEADVVQINPPHGFLDACESHELSGVQFSRLRLAYHFVYLILHVFRHLIGSWTRLLSLYEIAAIIRAHSSDDDLWREVSAIIAEDKSLGPAAALVLGLVTLTFPLPAAVAFPRTLKTLCVRGISSESSLWVASFSAECLFSEPPGNKLTLLVQQQFSANRQVWRKYVFRRLFPVSKTHGLSDDPGKATKRALSYRVEDLRYTLTRAWYHVRSDYEYLIAKIRWDRLLRKHCESVRCISGGY